MRHFRAAARKVRYPTTIALRLWSPAPAARLPDKRGGIRRMIFISYTSPTCWGGDPLRSNGGGASCLLSLSRELAQRFDHRLIFLIFTDGDAQALRQAVIGNMTHDQTLRHQELVGARRFLRIAE